MRKYAFIFGLVAIFVGNSQALNARDVKTKLVNASKAVKCKMIDSNLCTVAGSKGNHAKVASILNECRSVPAAIKKCREKICQAFTFNANTNATEKDNRFTYEVYTRLSPETLKSLRCKEDFGRNEDKGVAKAFAKLEKE